jgi:hypothetical protein
MSLKTLRDLRGHGVAVRNRLEFLAGINRALAQVEDGRKDGPWGATSAYYKGNMRGTWDLMHGGNMTNN